ncbi:MAG TPA: PPC domain-containing protein [Allosphingosinicella sp.]|nr:PPC domain-containing protein [Allosphingosinicella sp.]
MRSTLASVSFAALVLALSPASAQAPWSVAGELADADRQDESRRRYDEHGIRLEAGGRYRIAVDSEAFDAVARLYRAGEAQPVAENDDSAGLNPRLTYAPAQGGDYVLRVVAFSEAGRGAYTARLEALPPLPPGAAVPWSMSGVLEDRDGGGDAGADGRRYDEFPLRLEAGRRYRLFVESEAFDPVASLLAPGGGDEVARNDDSGGTLNSRIAFSPPETGDFVLRVSAFGADARGAYRAGAELMPPLPPPVSSPGTSVTVNGSWSLWQGMLADSDPDTGGRRFDDYLIRVEAGQRRSISLEGNGFDALVQVLRPAARESDSPDIVDENDDAGAGLNAFLVFAPEEAGDYIVRVTSVGDGVGAYRLWISQ